jgi:hypothetical protein
MTTERVETLKVSKCPECGEQERSEVGPSRWFRAKGLLTHYHPGEKPHWPGHRVKAEEVEVVPVDRVRDALTCGPLREEFAEALGRMIADQHAAKTYTSSLVWLLAEGLTRSVGVGVEGSDAVVGLFPSPPSEQPLSDRELGVESSAEGWYWLRAIAAWAYEERAASTGERRRAFQQVAIRAGGISSSPPTEEDIAWGLSVSKELASEEAAAENPETTEEGERQ